MRKLTSLKQTWKRTKVSKTDSSGAVLDLSIHRISKLRKKRCFDLSITFEKNITYERNLTIFATPLSFASWFEIR
jgi:hypothetical protein